MPIFYLNLIATEEHKEIFKELYEKYVRLMKAICFEVLQNDSLADDAVQEAFIKIINAVNNGKVCDVHSNKTKAFIAIVTKNIARDILAKEKRVHSVFAEDTKHSDVEDNIFANELIEVIRNLPDIYRDVLIMRVVYDMTDKEISKALSITGATVRKRLERARTLLKNLLEE